MTNAEINVAIHSKVLGYTKPPLLAWIERETEGEIVERREVKW